MNFFKSKHTRFQRLFTGLVASSLLFFSCSEDNSNKGHPTSFNGIRWGTKLSDLQEMVFVESKGRLEIYAIKNDDLNIGTIEHKTAFYLFSEGHFCGVSVEYQGAENHEKMKQIYFEKFGNPQIVNEQEMMWKWVWPGEVGVVVEYDQQEETGYLTYSYSPLLLRR